MPYYEIVASNFIQRRRINDTASRAQDWLTRDSPLLSLPAPCHLFNYMFAAIFR